MRWNQKLDNLLGKFLCACMAYSFTLYFDNISLILFGELPYPEVEE